jgi:outer membrane murein-binding lipoprotein Lpp
MKHVLAIAATVLLAGCATSGMKDTLPKLSSKTGKSVTAYVQCVEPKWQALAPGAKGSAKDDAGVVTASKDGAHERLEVKATGSGAQVVMYEMQKVKSDYDSRYRDEAISCL